MASRARLAKSAFGDRGIFEISTGFRVLSSTAPGPTWGIGKSIGVLDLNLDGRDEILIPQSLLRQNGPGIPPWDGITALDQPVSVLRFDAGVGLTVVDMKDASGAPLVTGWVMDASVIDFNGDGKLDILFSDTGPEVTINGDMVLDRMRLITAGTSGPTVSIATQSYPSLAWATARGPSGYGFWHSSGAGDVNGDGKVDFVALNIQTFVGVPDNLAIFLGDGHGAFTYTKGLLPTAANTIGAGKTFMPAVLDVADLNGDGVSELVLGIANFAPDMERESRVFWNTGTGFSSTFTALPLPPEATITATGHAYKDLYVDRIRTGDLNGDGRPDLLFMLADGVNDTARWGQVFIQNADRSFTELNLWPDNRLPQLQTYPQGFSLEPVDVNGDGMLDIEFTHGSVNTLRDIGKLVWINMGDGTFKLMSEVAPDAIPNSGFQQWWRFVDLDGDGQAELLTQASTGPRSSVFVSLALGVDTIQATAGTPTAGTIFGDRMLGSSGNDSLSGGLGRDSIEAGAGNDTVSGGSGTDTISDGEGTNYLRGDEGNDSITGGSGFDDINGNQGNDTCASGGGDDWVVGGKGDDSLVGSSGQNLVYGNLGNDTCDGGAGDDIIRGGQNNDSLNGGAGADYVSGDRGDDTVQGGSGADIFHSFAEAGIDRILDFNLAEGDRVQLDPGTVYTVSQSGADTVINMVGGGQVILVGIQMSSLTTGWIFGA